MPTILIYCFWIFVRCILLNSTCIIHPVNAGDQIVGVVWCSSGIIFGSCCGGDFFLVQVKCVSLDPILENLEAENHHHQVLKLEPLEVWHHRGLVLVLGSMVLLPVLVIPIIDLFQPKTSTFSTRALI